MQKIAVLTKSGFTLIEVLVAIIILTVGLLGLMQTVIYAINHNNQNIIRHMAVSVADESMALEQSKPFDAISTVNMPKRTVSMRPINGVFKSYSIAKTNTAQTDQTKNIDIEVSWHYKGSRYTHSISSFITNASQ